MGNTKNKETTTPETTTPETSKPDTSGTVAPVEEPKDNRVKIYIERRSGNDEPNLVVGINGKNYVLPRGQESLVPPEVAAEIERSRKAQTALDKRIDELTVASK